MREVSTSTVQGKSPRQIVGSSCLRTAGVGSTGMSAARFISSGVASVASASVELRWFNRVVSSASRFSGAKASLGSDIVTSKSSTNPSQLRSVASSSVASSPVAYLGRLLRRSSLKIDSALSASRGGVASSSVALLRVGVRRSSQSPRTVLRSGLLRTTEVGQVEVAKRMSHRFAHPAVALVSVASQFERSSVNESRSSESCVGSVPPQLRSASPARAWRFH